jgi:hypothetical protein
MNDTYTNYIDQLLDLAERNDIFCLTSRAFNEFAAEVRETMAKGKPMKVIGRKNIYPNEYGVTMVEIKCPNCESFIEFESLRCYEPEYCDECGQKLNWED